MLILKNRLIMAVLALGHIVSMGFAFVRYGWMKYAFSQDPVKRADQI
jgi:hypothetical protein